MNSKEMEYLEDYFDYQQEEYLKRNNKEDIKKLDWIELQVTPPLLNMIYEKVKDWVNTKSSEKLYSSIKQIPYFTINLNELGQHEDFGYVVFNLIYKLSKRYPNVRLVYFNPGERLFKTTEYKPRCLKDELLYDLNKPLFKKDFTSTEILENSYISISFSLDGI